MKISRPNDIKSSFFDYLLASNRPYMAGFKKWLFQPGMLFNSQETWWGEKKPRATPHEGLDLCCFADATGQIKQLDKNIKIPATFAGKIVKIDCDFLGKSIYLSHEIFAADGRQLYTAYGHTEPLAAIQVGKVVEAGEIIAAVAAGPGKSPKLPSHLHLTLAWIPVSRPPDRLNWPNLGADRTITLIDPRSILLPPA
jgi:murein DD-endopeptidase MepM/ murein hydrolase activator NlpD